MSNTFQVKVEASINHICDELKLTSFVRTKCIEMSNRATTMTQAENNKLEADALASAIVSIVHEEARRNGRVAQHLPNKMIGKALGMDSGTVVHNIHLFNSRKH
jgi:hypothetical protein